jgi:hypothetical protein
MKFALQAVVGFATGIISGWGVGGGTILMVYLTSFAGINTMNARNINLMYFIPTSVSALYSHVKNGFVKWSCAIPAAAAGVFAACAGAIGAAYVQTELMKKFFGVFLILVGISELMKKQSPT